MPWPALAVPNKRTSSTQKSSRRASWACAVVGAMIHGIATRKMQATIARNIGPRSTSSWLSS
ncbi:50S ribosomal protein L32 [Brevundimonas sp. AAP58]|uniref:50S ribosomal protein L32 n=1 Tax=Brevundimonas sp. AAP58 TaxID=1523422 RepID=UPI0012E294B9